MTEQTDATGGAARAIIDGNMYMVLATVGPDGAPWAAPVFYSTEDGRDLYWVSSPEVTHSRNLAHEPRVGIVIHDSRAPVGHGGPARAVSDRHGDGAGRGGGAGGAAGHPGARRSWRTGARSGRGAAAGAVPGVPRAGRRVLDDVPARGGAVLCRARAGLRPPAGRTALSVTSVTDLAPWTPVDTRRYG